MFTQSELLEKKKAEVQEIAKELGIPRFRGKTSISKVELVAKILATQPSEDEDEKVNKEDVETPNETVEQTKPEVKESKLLSEVKKLKEKKILTDEEREAKKKKYVEDAQVGVLVAFKTDTGKVKSAMIMKRSTSKRRFLVETKYGAKFKISFDDVLWVRTNKRWPKGIFNLLRGEQPQTEEV